MKLADIEVGQEYLYRRGWRKDPGRGRVEAIERRQTRVGYTSRTQNRRMVVVQRLDHKGQPVGTPHDVESRDIEELWAPYAERTERKRREREAFERRRDEALANATSALQLLGLETTDDAWASGEAPMVVVGRDLFSSRDRHRIALRVPFELAGQLLDAVASLKREAERARANTEEVTGRAWS